jgi:hypothetical protein
MGSAGLGAVPLELAAVAEMGARAKCLALRGQHQRAAFVVRIECLKGGGEFFDQRDVEEIIRRPPDFHQRHVAALLHANVFERAHDVFLRVSLFGRAAAFLQLDIALDDERIHHRNTIRPARAR